MVRNAKMGCATSTGVMRSDRYSGRCKRVAKADFLRQRPAQASSSAPLSPHHFTWSPSTKPTNPTSFVALRLSRLFFVLLFLSLLPESSVGKAPPTSCPTRSLDSRNTQGGVIIVSPGGVGSSSFFGELGKLRFKNEKIAANDCRNGDHMKHARPAKLFSLLESQNKLSAVSHIVVVHGSAAHALLSLCRRDFKGRSYLSLQVGYLDVDTSGWTAEQHDAVDRCHLTGIEVVAKRFQSDPLDVSGFYSSWQNEIEQPTHRNIRTLFVPSFTGNLNDFLGIPVSKFDAAAAAIPDTGKRRKGNHHRHNKKKEKPHAYTVSQQSAADQLVSRAARTFEPDFHHGRAAISRASVITAETGPAETSQTVTALYTDTVSYKRDCCLSNTIMSVVTHLARMCMASLSMENTVVILPPDMDVGGRFRRHVAGQNALGIALLNGTAITKLAEFALTLGCTVIDRAAAAAARVEQSRFVFADGDTMNQGPFLRWVFQNMQLPPVLHNVVEQCFSKDVLTGKPFVAVHLRIEKDWQRSPKKGGTRHSYCENRPILAASRGDEPIKACYSPKEIAAALLESKLVPKSSTQTHVLIYGDPAPQFAKGTGENPLEVWPIVFPLVHVEHKDSHSTECSQSLKSLTYNERAFVDMWVATKATHFVGIMSSTFSNSVTQVRHSTGRDSSFAYSCPDVAPLVPRLDNGELQGGSDGAACRTAAGKVGERFHKQLKNGSSLEFS